LALWAYASFSESQVPGFRSAIVIERNLKAEAAQALAKAGAGWAGLEIHGQSAIVTGIARTEAERDIALRAVRRAGWPSDAFRSGPLHFAVYYLAGAEAARKLEPGGPVWGGVVSVADKTALAPVQSPFTWRASIVEGRRLRIEGFAPSEGTRAELLRQAESLFPSGVEDHSQVARGAPKGNWQAAVSWALGSLERLSEGSELQFTNAEFFIRGVTDNPALPSQIQQRIVQVVPPFRGAADIAIVGEQVPPAVTPAPVPISEFSWSAQLTADRRAVLSGYAPSEAIRAEVLAAAQTEFPAGVDDRTLIGTAAPNGDWPSAARWTLRLLSKLDTGDAAVTGNRLTITGVAARADIQALVVNGARQIAEPFTGDASVVLPGEQPPAVPTPPQPEPPAAPHAEPPPPDLTGPQEPEAANRSADALRCQGIIDGKLSGQVIEFDSGRSAIKASSFALLDDIADTALKCPGLRLIVAGHTDNSGSARQNKSLSEQRARAVVAYLRNKGVANGRMSARGYGAERPRGPNDTEDGKARNRRIQITVID
jgi:outer membrane protein OmpA-like peptidoglycan-associated protein